MICKICNTDNGHKCIICGFGQSSKNCELNNGKCYMCSEKTQEDLSCKIETIINKYICKYENCSDSNDKQFPICEEFRRRLCPINKFRSQDLVDELLNFMYNNPEFFK